MLRKQNRNKIDVQLLTRFLYSSKMKAKNERLPIENLLGEI